MATIKVNVCRFFGNTVLPKLSVALFKNSSSSQRKVSQAHPFAMRTGRLFERRYVTRHNFEYV